jgi:mRNA-degrading endonuclease RelE of RelBE toxin-antitoxin system
MKHLTLPRFWKYYQYLPEEIQKIADKNYKLLKSNPYHLSLHLKKVGKRRQIWSVRVGDSYRALGTEKREGIVWFWIGTHEEYDKILKKDI